MTRDISILPHSVQAKARVLDNGEVAWRLDEATDAINALADNGQIILGLDFREYFPDDGYLEMPWSSYEPEGRSTDVEYGRQSALAELVRGIGVHSLTTEHWVLVTW